MRRLHEERADGSEPRTPFPTRRAYLIGLVLFANGFSSMLVFPFAPAMVHGFFPALSATEIGYRAGYLTSAFFCGSFLGSVGWGYLADHWGRRPVLLVGMLGTCGSVACFGFSSSFAQALLSRFAWGLLNGNIGVAKTYMSEICDDSNQARGMALIAAQGGFGRLTGPAVGGYLAEPAAQYPELFRGIAVLEAYPYALPCLVGAAIAILTFAGAACSLQETLPSRRAAACCAPRHVRAGPAAAAAEPPRPGALGGRRRTVRLALALYFGTGFFQIGVHAVVPLWLVSDLRHGGFGDGTARWQAKDIGLLMSMVGPFQMAAQLFAFPRLARRYGYRRLFVVSLAASAAFTAAIPLASAAFAGPRHGKAVPMAAVLVVFLAAQITCMFGFTCNMVFINNAVPRAHRGRLNGLAQALVALARILGPAIASNLFAWSATSDRAWPLNYHAAFYLQAATGLAAAALALRLPETIEKQARDAPPQEEAAAVAAAMEPEPKGEPPDERAAAGAEQRPKAMVAVASSRAATSLSMELDVAERA